MALAQWYLRKDEKACLRYAEDIPTSWKYQPTAVSRTKTAMATWYNTYLPPSVFQETDGMPHYTLDMTLEDKLGMKREFVWDKWYHPSPALTLKQRPEARWF